MKEFDRILKPIQEIAAGAVETCPVGCGCKGTVAVGLLAGSFDFVRAGCNLEVEIKRTKGVAIHRFWGYKSTFGKFVSELVDSLVKYDH